MNSGDMNSDPLHSFTRQALCQMTISLSPDVFVLLASYFQMHI